jgi:hypothetical protein
MKSPNYPAIGLSEAITRLREIYQAQKTYPADRETFAQILGYKGLNGSSVRVISALTKFGLLEGAGDSIHVSAVGQDLVLHQQGDSEYEAAIDAVAFRPAFFQEMREMYPHGLPSDHALRAALMKKGFAEGAVENAVAVFRESETLVRRLSKQKASTEQLPSSNSEPETSKPPNLESMQSVDQKGSSTGLRAVVLPLSGGVWAELRGPFPVTGDAWDQMLTVLNAMKPALTRAESEMGENNE